MSQTGIVFVIEHYVSWKNNLHLKFQQYYPPLYCYLTCNIATLRSTRKPELFLVYSDLSTIVFKYTFEFMCVLRNVISNTLQAVYLNTMLRCNILYLSCIWMLPKGRCLRFVRFQFIAQDFFFDQMCNEFAMYSVLTFMKLQNLIKN